MKDLFGSVAAAALTIVVAGTVVFGAAYASYKMYEFFAPRYRHVEAETFKQSEQYNDGMIRDLENLKLEYQRSDADGKAAMRPIILHRFSIYDRNRLPADLNTFYDQIQSGVN